MVQKLFPLIADERVDTRTRDLRDYLCEPASLSVAARELQLASPAVLDNAFSDLKKRLRGNRLSAPQQSADDLERARSLRQLANRLRVAGRLREAREAFRRALIVTPADAGLVYEFARLLRSQASAAGDARLLYRARAALRLAALRAGDDAALLAQIGESLIECGDTVRAERTLQRALNVDASNFRALVQLGDLALRNGKLAHVIHHYREAAHSAPDKVLAAYARREADYYARLNDDEDYLGSELRRISWLQNAGRVRRLAARITNASILVALVGPYVDQTVASIGWSLASSSLCGWLAALFVGKLLGERRNPDPTE